MQSGRWASGAHGTGRWARGTQALGAGQEGGTGAGGLASGRAGGTGARGRSRHAGGDHRLGARGARAREGRWGARAQARGALGSSGATAGAGRGRHAGLGVAWACCWANRLCTRCTQPVLTQFRLSIVPESLNEYCSLQNFFKRKKVLNLKKKSNKIRQNFRKNKIFKNEIFVDKNILNA